MWMSTTWREAWLHCTPGSDAEGTSGQGSVPGVVVVRISQGARLHTSRPPVLGGYLVKTDGYTRLALFELRFSLGNQLKP